MDKLQKILLNIVDEEEWTIRSFIAQEALKRKPYIALFFEELIREIAEYGFANWIIKSLSNYRNSYRFFNQHYREISNALLEYTDEEEWFYGFKWNDLLSSIVRLAVEKIARDMAREDLGLDI